MNSYVQGAVFGAQPRNVAGRATIFHWIKRKLAERRQRMAQKGLIAQLRSLDRHMLNDLAIDPDVLASDAIAALSRQNPHVIAACMFADGLNRGHR